MERVWASGKNHRNTDRNTRFGRFFLLFVPLALYTVSLITEVDALAKQEEAGNCTKNRSEILSSGETRSNQPTDYPATTQ